MSTVNPVGSNSGVTPQPNRKAITDLGINDFIALMTTQLKYQDPTKPQDSSQFVAQLAQFSTVSGVQSMNTSMSAFLSQLKSAQALNATALVGHDVLVSANSLAVNAGETVQGAVQVPEGAQNVNMLVTDDSGQLVRQFPVAVTNSTAPFTWDGLDNNGRALPSSHYHFQAIANVYGKSVSANTLLSSKVDSVTIDPADSSLVLNTKGFGSVVLADVQQVF